MVARYLTSPINDWPIRRLLIVSAVLWALMAVLTGLACAGCDIPVLRQIAGFIFLAFIPGVLILRIFRIHGINAIEGLVYSTGLSIAFVLLSGALINLILPVVGIQRPLSLLPVTIAIGSLVVILMIFAWVRDKSFTPPATTLPVPKIPLVPVLSLILLVALTVLGVTLIDCFQSNILLLICLIGIAAVIGLAAFGKFITPALYPLTIFTIGLCLLYQTTLMSPYPIGSDIYTEYHFYRLAADAGFWNASIPNIVNSCLSITILAPVYSLFMGVDGNWLFKAVYPFIFALVPLILFEAFSRQIGPKRALLSVFFFISVPTFSMEMIALCRQQIAELFLALIILLLVERKLQHWQKITALIIFAVSMVVSHYALGLIGFAYIAFLLLSMLIIRNRPCRRLWGCITGQTDGDINATAHEAGSTGVKALIILLAVFFIAGASWYGFIASGLNAATFNSIWTEQTQIISTQIGRLVEGIHPQTPAQAPAFIQFNNRDGLIRTAVGLDFPDASPPGKGFRILQYITQLLLIIGFLKTILRPGKSGFKVEFMSLSVAGIFLILACLIMPRFADYLNVTRLYHIALMTLAPFCILGGEAVWRGAVDAWQRIKRAIAGNRASGFVSRPGTTGYDDRPGGLRFVALVVLIPYFLFTSGCIYEITGQSMTEKVDLPYSIALSSYRLDLAGVLYAKDGAAAQWVSQRSDNLTGVYADRHGANLLRFYEFHGSVLDLPHDARNLLPNSYIFLNTVNISHRAITFAVATGLRQYIIWDDIPGLTQVIDDGRRIYNNGDAHILYLH